MTLRSMSVLVPAMAAIIFATPAFAQNTPGLCAERDRVVGEFRAEFNENPTAVGLVSEDTLLEVLTSDKGTWTILITRPDGASCLVASGVAWQSVGTEASHRAPESGPLASDDRKQLIAAEAADPIE